MAAHLHICMCGPVAHYCWKLLKNNNTLWSYRGTTCMQPAMNPIHINNYSKLICHILGQGVGQLDNQCQDNQCQDNQCQDNQWLDNHSQDKPMD